MEKRIEESKLRALQAAFDAETDPARREQLRREIALSQATVKLMDRVRRS